MNPHRPSLWHNPDFVKLWAAATISIFGSLITRTALPFTAIFVLKATPIQIALLAAADLASQFLVGLVAGVWADRLRRRPIMIAADLGRAALLGTIPLAAFFHALRIEQLYAVAFLTGILTVFFDVADQSYLPTLVRREELPEGNGKLSASASIAEVGAFGLSGWLVQLLTGITQVSLRQAITPERVLGRANASIRFSMLGAMLAGSLLGGLMGETIGLRATLTAAAGGILLSALWLILSPLRTLKDPLQPAPEKEISASMGIKGSVNFVPTRRWRTACAPQR